MRFVLLVCAGLLFANVAVFLWPATNSIAPHIYAKRADINPNLLSLNKEVESRYYASARATTKNDELGQSFADNESCYRLGPFMHLPNYELAQVVLFDTQVDFLKSTRPAQNSEVFRVYLGPFVTQAEIDDLRLDLKRKKILDHFVKKEGEERYIVSLGIYTTETASSAAVALFSDVLVDVKMKLEQLLLPESHWLHLALDDGQSVRQELSNMDWGEVSVKLGKHECLEG